jgi:hypothetical protein
MAKRFAKLGKVLFFLGILFLFLWFVLPNNVSANAGDTCCDDPTCGFGYICVNNSTFAVH